MKLKNIFLLVGITLGLCFSSCSDDDGYKWGAVASGNQLNAVTFGADNVISTELDPADPTIINVKVYRDKADEAVEVPIKVITNDGSVFVVPEKVTFAAEQKEAFIDIAFDKAEIGTTYSLEIALDDDYVNPYLSSTTKTYAYEVTRVKWKSLGKSIWIDDFWYGEVFEVELYQRDDKPTSYRFENPYTDEYTGGNATYQKYIVLDTNNGYVSWDKYFFINTFVDDYGAELKGYYPSALDEEEAASYEAELEKLGFKVSSVEVYNDGSHTKGQVRASYPSAPEVGAKVALGEEIILQVYGEAQPPANAD